MMIIFAFFLPNLTNKPKTFLSLQSDEVLNEAIGQDCNLGINRFH